MRRVDSEVLKFLEKHGSASFYFLIAFLSIGYKEEDVRYAVMRLLEKNKIAIDKNWRLRINV